MCCMYGIYMCSMCVYTRLGVITLFIANYNYPPRFSVTISVRITSLG